MRLCPAPAAPAVAACLLAAASAGAAPPPDWPARLQPALERLAASAPPAALGVYVRDLADGRSVSLQADQRWYLASMVKLPVAVAVLRAVERGALTLDTRLVLRAHDLVDGAGTTARRPVGSPIAVRTLLEQMMIESDNTASDMLIELVGLRAVQDVVDAVAPGAFGRFTTLADVRRGIYGQLAPAADRLAGHDFLLLKAQASDAQRVALLPALLHVPAQSLAAIDLGAAYARYYASGVNSGRLDAYGELVAQLAEGRLLDAPRTMYLLDVMARARTGTHRIRAGLPPGTRFAHKTGTQRARTCDAGLVTRRTADGPRRLIVAACTRGEASLAQAERLPKGVGLALRRSGALGATPPDPRNPARSPSMTLPVPRPISRRPLILAPLAMAAALLRPRLAAADPTASGGWTAALRAEVERLARTTPGRFGLYVKRLDSGETFAYQADRPWYLGSSTKLPIAVAVLQAIQAGRLNPAQRVMLKESDKIDGSGPLVWQAAGGAHGVDTLLRRMLMAGDNTAANLLVRTLGPDALNASVRASLGPGVTLTDFTAVRRDVYAELWPQARELPNRALVEIAAAPVGPQRLRALQRRLGDGAGPPCVRDFDEAYARYYARGLNSASLVAYGGLLERLVKGELLPGDELPGLYRDLKFDTYDAYRLEAGLPRERRFIHKTGTQYRRACHMGVVDPQDGGRHAAVVATCAEDLDEHREAAPLFEALGRAITRTALGVDGAR